MVDKKAPDPGNRAPTDGGADQVSAMIRPNEGAASDLIGRHLKLIYDAVASQPVPDRFLELLNRLDDKTQGE